MKPSDLRTLQLIELKILLEVKRVCDKLGIKYFLIGGTLLGAVRHQGFIPWDDDIDIGMRREDYNRFIAEFPSHSRPEYLLSTCDTDKGWKYVFGKVRIHGTEYPEPCNCHILDNNEIWVDVFPFDNIPNSIWKRKIHIILLEIIELVLRYKYKYVTPMSKKIYGKICHIMCKKLSVVVSRKLLINARDAILLRYNERSTKYVINWPFKAAKREYFDELTELPFETVLFPVPKMYHEYLTSFYGDYMRIPPENERPKHSPYEPDFGKYAYIKTLDDVLPKKE